MKSIEIEIDGKKYTVNELTVGQVETLHILNDELNPADTKSSWNYYVNVLSTALLPIYPEMKPDHIRTLRIGNIQTIAKIVRSIMLFSGLIVEKVSSGDPQPGEAQA